jgi:hypothetical protein
MSTTPGATAHDAGRGREQRLERLREARRRVHRMIERHERLRQIAAEGEHKALARALEAVAEAGAELQRLLTGAMLEDVGWQRMPIDEPDHVVTVGWSELSAGELASNVVDALEADRVWVATRLEEPLDWTDEERRVLDRVVQVLAERAREVGRSGPD